MSERLWNANYLKAWSANFMLNFSFMVMTPLLPLYLSEEFGADKDQIGLVLSGYALTALMVRPFSGFFVDSFPRKAVLMACYLVFFILFGGFTVLVEFFEHISFGTQMFLWSLFPLAGFGAAGLLLIIAGIIPPLRQAFAKRFFF